MRGMRRRGLRELLHHFPSPLRTWGNPCPNPRPLPSIPPPPPPRIYRYPEPLERRGRDGASEWGTRAWGTQLGGF